MAREYKQTRMGKVGLSKMFAYYQQLKEDNWAGNDRDIYSPRRIGTSAKQRHLSAYGVLGGIYMTGAFRTKEPRLLTSARYAVAPIVSMTKSSKMVGQIAWASLQTLKMAQQTGIAPASLTGKTYADIPRAENPYKRAKGLFINEKSKDVRIKYGLGPKNDLAYGDFNATFIPDEAAGKQQINFKNPDTGKETSTWMWKKFITKTSIEQEEYEDMIPVKFKNGTIGTVQLRGLIKDLSDTITPTWNEQAYVGRPQAMLSYGGFTREVSFGITMAPSNPHQLRPMYRQLSRLAAFALPMVDPAAPMSRYAGSFCNVTIGNYLNDELCVLSGLTITPNTEAPWETMDPDLEYPSMTLARWTEGPLQAMFGVDNLAFGSAPSKDPDVGNTSKKKPLKKGFEKRMPDDERMALATPFKVPRFLDLQITLKLIHKKMPGNPTSVYQAPLVPVGAQDEHTGQ